ncbi:TRAP transporter substrate-binding protein [Desulfosarcina cetonica]|uniref:TRAP transporter substrate-binding protein n=1 Tax=Desulfosarcina cetonica TaxID=90730 RepID=UPI0006CF9D46|nr:TRAP transporter substrate-binding protein [Desulfosarcina cetonica]
MRSKKTAVGSIALLALLLIVPQGNLSAAPKVIDLKFATYLPGPHGTTKACEQFIADLEEQTHGQVKVQFFPGGSLAKAPSMIKAIETGIVDIGLSHISYTPGRFPVTEVCELPIGYPTGWVANIAMNDFYDKYKPKEWDSVVPLWFHANSPSILASTKPIRTMDDFKGQIIRAPGRMADVITALGGTPAPTPIVETYDAIAKGVIHGVFVGMEGVRAFKFGEVTPYVTNSWNVGPSYPFYVAMNKRKYEKLPADVKAVFDRLCGEYKEKFALVWNASDFPGEAFGKQKGVEFIELSQAEFDRWITAVEPVFDAYVKSMVDKGFKEDEVKSWIAFLKRARPSFSNSKRPCTSNPPKALTRYGNRRLPLRMSAKRSEC